MIGGKPGSKRHLICDGNGTPIYELTSGANVHDISRALHQFRPLAVRGERRLDIHDGLVSLACVLICWRRLLNWTDQRSC